MIFVESVGEILALSFWLSIRSSTSKSCEIVVRSQQHFQNNERDVSYLLNGKEEPPYQWKFSDCVKKIFEVA